MKIQTTMHEELNGNQINREELIDNMDPIYNPETEASKIKKAILRSQRCQRNWDLSKQLSPEQLELIITAATECPTKQNIPFYNVKVVQNREKIEAIYEHTFGEAPNDPENVQGKKNPQVLANTLLVFSVNDYSREIGDDRSPETARKADERTEHDRKVLYDDVMQSIGIAAGYVNLTASMLGLQTGCCKCIMDTLAIQKIIGSEEHETPLLLMGIGFADKTKARRADHVTGKILPSYNKRIGVEILN